MAAVAPLCPPPVPAGSRSARAALQLQRHATAVHDSSQSGLASERESAVERAHTERAKLKHFAQRLTSLEVGQGLPPHRTRPQSVNVLLVGGPGTGKSTFYNFSWSFLQLAAGKDGMGFKMRAGAGAKAGGYTTAFTSYLLTEGIVLSDSRGFEGLTKTARKTIVGMAGAAPPTQGIDMTNAMTERLPLPSSYFQGANSSHHAVLFFISAEHAVSPFDEELYNAVAKTLLQLKSEGFQPLVVLSKTDLVKSEAAVQAYREKLVKHFQDWTGKKGAKLGLDDNHVMLISNVVSSDAWTTMMDDPFQQLELLRRGTAVLNVVETAVDFGNAYIRTHPSVKDKVYSWTVDVSATITSLFHTRSSGAALSQPPTQEQERSKTPPPESHTRAAMWRAFTSSNCDLAVAAVFKEESDADQPTAPEVQRGGIGFDDPYAFAGAATGSEQPNAQSGDDEQLQPACPVEDVNGTHGSFSRPFML